MIWSTDVYQCAIDFAARAHRCQKVPGKPYAYVVHLANVSMEIMAASSQSQIQDPDLAIQCALLHDVLEDTHTRLDEVASAFGQAVGQGVLALTENRRLPTEMWLKDSVKRILLQPQEVWMVKLADRITNLQEPPGHWSKERIRAYKVDAEFILLTLGGCNPHLEARLREKIDQYAHYLIS